MDLEPQARETNTLTKLVGVIKGMALYPTTEHNAASNLIRQGRCIFTATAAQMSTLPGTEKLSLQLAMNLPADEGTLLCVN